MDWWMQQQFARAFDPDVVVRETIEARGFAWLKNGRPGQELLLSRSNMGFGSSNADEYEKYLRTSRTFRRMLALLVDKQDDAPYPEEVLARKSGCNDRGRLRDYLTVLEGERLVACTDGAWALAPDVSAKQFGPTFEWLVSRTFVERMHWPAAHSVSLEDCEYNDYDVIAVRGSEIIVVECKATHAVEDQELHAFARRHQFLLPTLSILLVDTKEPLPKLAKRLDKCGKIGGFQTCKIDPKEGLFLLIPGDSAATSLYIANTAAGTDGILRALQLCIRNHVGPRAGAGIWDGWWQREDTRI